MAIQINPRTAILGGVVVLAAAAAGAWFFLFEEDAPPPKVVTVPPPGATKAAAATSAAVKDAVKAAEGAPKPAATPGAPATAKPAAKPAPIPTDPDKLIAEIIETSGMRNQLRSFAAEVASGATSASQGQEEKSTVDPRAVAEISARHFQPDAMMSDLVQGMKAAYEAERMGRFLELLRQPIALKMSALEGRQVSREDRAKFAEDFRKNPPSAARQKQIVTLDEVTRNSELGLAITTLAAREMVDAMFDGLQKAGKRPPKEARQLINSQIGASEPQMRAGFRTLMHITYRDVSDEELGEYVKLLDSETGRWGAGVMAGALRPAVEKRLRPFARDMAALMLQQQLASKTTTLKDAAAAAPVGKPAERSAAPRAAVAPVAAAPPAEAPGYQRAPGIKQLYTRHNDLVTAVVMRDAASVRELLADGKNPDVRQSDGFTPLMIAAANGDTAIAELLLSRRADPNLRTPDGQTALSLARRSNAAGMVQLLQRSGARG
jgi:hypothetical protein